MSEPGELSAGARSVLSKLQDESGAPLLDRDVREAQEAAVELLYPFLHSSLMADDDMSDDAAREHANRILTNRLNALTSAALAQGRREGKAAERERWLEKATDPNRAFTLEFLPGAGTPPQGIPEGGQGKGT